MSKRYIAFHKPYGVLSQFTGEANQRTLAEFNFPKGVYAAGRLDKDSEGLLLLTNDGPLKHTLLHPNNDHKKTYWVQVEGVPTPKALQQLQRGVLIKGYRTKPCTATIIQAPNIPPREPPIRERKSIPTTWLCGRFWVLILLNLSWLFQVSFVILQEIEINQFLESFE